MENDLRRWMRLVESADFAIKDVTVRNNGDGSFDALWRGKRIGYAAVDMSRSDGDEYSMSGSRVAKDFQRKGVGTLLYDAADAWLEAKGYQLVPSSPDELSKEAQQFWKKRDPWGNIKFDNR